MINPLKNKKNLLLLVVALAALALGIKGFIFYRANLTGVGPAILPAPADLPEPGAATPTDLGLKLPPGFSAEVFAKDLPGARVMKFDTTGNLWVSRSNKGTVTLLEIKDGKAVSASDILTGLRNPHGLAFDPDDPFVLYIAEEHAISRVRVYSESKLRKIADLPAGGGHSTRTLGFGPDGRLYVSIGSSCNVCLESDERRAKIFSMNKDGSDFKEFARGLRNTVFFAWNADGKLWGTDMGRDLIGDDLPPDEVNVIEAGGNYGWPICYGKNIHDDNFDKNTYFRNPCLEPFEKESALDLQAHSAPLGLAFIPSSGKWPAEYTGNLLVAYHGSWNRSVPTGYKLVRFRPDGSPGYREAEDFVSGWLTEENGKYSAWGRPVDIYVSPEGWLLVSDDKAGAIYKLSYGLN